MASIKSLTLVEQVIGFSPMPGRVYIKTFGCQMNEYDSSRMLDVLRSRHGFVPTDNPAEADLLLLNTCSVRDKAQEKVFSHLGRFRELKAARPGLLIGVGGCVASQEGEDLLKRAPFVDLVFGPQTLHRLPDFIDEVRARGRPVVDVSFPEIEKFDRLPEPRANGPTAFVSVMEGCSKYCSFCVVPFTRGEEVSRPMHGVLAEVHQLATQGVREVTLLGQNVNGYRGETDAGDTADLAALIERVALIDGIERIRFTTSHPREFSDRLVGAEGMWITRQALQNFTSTSHCIYRFPDGRTWVIWRTFSKTDVRRFWVHHRFWWPGRVNPLLPATDPLANRTMMSMDDVQITLPMTPADPNPSTPFNEAVMIVDENGQQHFQGQPGFELMPDIAGNPNGFQLATTAHSTDLLPAATNRIVSAGT